MADVMDPDPVRLSVTVVPRHNIHVPGDIMNQPRRVRVDKLCERATYGSPLVKNGISEGCGQDRSDSGRVSNPYRSTRSEGGLGGGGRRIRTFGRFTASGFQDQRIRPLCHTPSPGFQEQIIRPLGRVSTDGVAARRGGGFRRGVPGGLLV